MSSVGDFFEGEIKRLGDPGGSKAKKKAKRSRRRAKSLREETKRADDLTNAFGKTLLNDPLGKSRSLLQGRPGGAGGGTVLGG